MSLQEQIHAIDNLILYIEKTLPGEVGIIEENSESAINFFRQNGRSEIAQNVESNMSAIKEKLDKLMKELQAENCVYLRGVRDDLYRAMND